MKKIKKIDICFDEENYATLANIYYTEDNKNYVLEWESSIKNADSEVFVEEYNGDMKPVQQCEYSVASGNFSYIEGKDYEDLYQQVEKWSKEHDNARFPHRYLLEGFEPVYNNLLKESRIQEKTIEPRWVNAYIKNYHDGTVEIDLIYEFENEAGERFSLYKYCDSPGEFLNEELPEVKLNTTYEEKADLTICDHCDISCEPKELFNELRKSIPEHADKVMELYRGILEEEQDRICDKLNEISQVEERKR